MFSLANMMITEYIRIFFYWIDSIIFNIIPSVYDMLIQIARTSILSQGDIAVMADRIYKLLAIFMIFKVTFSLIMYVVNPDDFSDKSKGIGKLTTNIIIVLSLLVLTPYIFRMAYELQTIILEDNSLAELVFGKQTDDNFMNSAGDDMAFISLSPFFTPNTAIPELFECSNLLTYNPSGDAVVNESCVGIDLTNYETINDSDSIFAILEDDDKDGTAKTSSTILTNYVTGLQYKNASLMFRQEMVTARTTKASGGEQFIMDYKFAVSTVVGIVILLLLVTFCMDIAVRSIKLAFLQLIAPIPIISYIDPKSGKDGMFKKWYQLCFKTYLSLFVRLLALYFAIFIISKVADWKLIDIIDGHYITNGLIYIFIIIGALMFAKQLPKILEGLGIKLDGDGKFFLNPLRKLENQALGGQALKKPNDALAKMGKGILKSPISGLQTLGKKAVAGTYSGVNGRGFSRGWKSVDSPLKKNLNKKIDEWAPDFAKDRQEARVAKLDAQEDEKKAKKMKVYFEDSKGNKVEAALAKTRFKADLAKVDGKYAELYEDAEKKKGKMYEAQANADTWISRIQNKQLTAGERSKLVQSLGKSDDISDSELVQEIRKQSGTAEKVYEKAVAEKERYGKTSSSARRAAAMDKAYDSYEKLYASSGHVPPAPSSIGSSGNNSSREEQQNEDSSREEQQNEDSSREEPPEEPPREEPPREEPPTSDNISDGEELLSRIESAMNETDIIKRQSLQLLYNELKFRLSNATTSAMFNEIINDVKRKFNDIMSK